KTEMNQTINDLKQQQHQQIEQLKIKFDMNVTNLEKLVKRKCDEQGKQIDDFKDKLLDKIQTMTTLITNIQQLKLDFIQQNIEFKKQLKQCQIKFGQSKGYKQNANIRKRRLDINTLIEEDNDDEDNEQKEKEQDIARFKFNKNCEHMISMLRFPSLKNGVDFLLVSENYRQIKLKTTNGIITILEYF
ncbi:hypothetical protein RFI_31981, partial [Reticulomyxa filosa]